jgi:hypothetical protein
MKSKIEITFPINNFIINTFPHDNQLYIYSFSFYFDKSMDLSENIENPKILNILKYLNIKTKKINYNFITSSPLNNKIMIFNMVFNIINNYIDNKEIDIIILKLINKQEKIDFTSYECCSMI